MKAQTTILQKKSRISGFTVLMFLFALVMGLNPLQAQNTSSSNTITVKGMVSDEDGPLTGVNIALEGSKAGAITDMDGTFIFPTPLKVGDVLVFSYLGYKTQRIEINENSTFIDLKLTSEHIDIVGAPSVDTPYKSKRSR
ncbi:carboxypeptidase-like regulatory domain-containing protein [Psychroserpens sp. XS_ASV72]|uniref:carboxypeptidase-like regulatory domain-containing protein n=1 Tax=Psychroserpens sp. XS_ASV72 TaxID=3241293 RepID=UPI003513F1AB